MSPASSARGPMPLVEDDDELRACTLGPSATSPWSVLEPNPAFPPRRQFAAHIPHGRVSVLLWIGPAAAATAAVILLAATPRPVTRDHIPVPVASSPVVSFERPAPLVATPARSAAPPRFSVRHYVARPKPIRQRAATPSRPAVRYAVRFGTFTDPVAATRLMRVVRAKGYIAYTVPQGGGRTVVRTRPYPTRTQAERVLAGVQAADLTAATLVEIHP